MGFPWYLKPELLLHAEMLEQQDILAQASETSYRRNQMQDKQIAALSQRVTELEQQVFALEALLVEKGILPPPPQEPQTEPDTPVMFPCRVETPIFCPRCGKKQSGNRNFCYNCEVPFTYETEQTP
ncbi:MAG: zinc ribbon domain-containing protein [Clostridia bacterium]|nr:zinc ribbon domain-containing protein [Clostridia bacterium]